MVADGQRWDIAEGCQRLLVYLALQECPQSRGLVAATLWPDKTDRRAGANLRSSIWRLPEPLGKPLVVGNGCSLELAEHLDVDVRRVEAAGWALLKEPDDVIDDVDPALFHRELLPGWYDDWVIFERARLAQLQMHFLEALTYALIDRHRLPQALDIALRLVDADPLREGGQKALLAVYAAEGNHGQARRQYVAYRELIRQTFGCEPSIDLADNTGGAG
jgi:DNA-binding SARP family transcriptional activator